MSVKNACDDGQQRSLGGSLNGQVLKRKETKYSYVTRCGDICDVNVVNACCPNSATHSKWTFLCGEWLARCGPDASLEL